MTKQALYDRIAHHTKLAFGNVINPHLFRGIAATTQAILDPEHATIAAPLLGHRDFGTTERYYLQGRMLMATRRYQDELQRRRMSLAKKPP